jgi:hypothetical protein
MNIYDRISLILNNENLTLSEFDRKIGVKVGYTSQVLKKKSRIPHTIIIKICNNFPQYSCEWLLFGTNSPHKKFITLVLKIKDIIEIKW